MDLFNKDAEDMDNDEKFVRILVSGLAKGAVGLATFNGVDYIIGSLLKTCAPMPIKIPAQIAYQIARMGITAAAADVATKPFNDTVDKISGVKDVDVEEVMKKKVEDVSQDFAKKAVSKVFKEETA